MINQMRQAIQDEWEISTEVDFRRYVESMHKRCQLTIKARGSSIKCKCYHFIQNPELYLANQWFLIEKGYDAG